MTMIWIVEDEERISAVLTAYLTQAGFATRSFTDGQNIPAAAAAELPDLILLDLMLPGLDGIEICRQIRRSLTIPIVMLTARVEEIDRLVGLELGADDYICKPFSPREVVARVKAVLRRSTTSTATATTSLGKRCCHAGIELDHDRYEARLHQHLLDLTPREFKLLGILMENPGRVYSREQLMQHLYHEDIHSSDRMIDTHVKNLRKKLASIQPEQEFIQALYGIGYKFNTGD